ncbi:carboxylesterase family protein [Nonomuraea jabiensis]|uniref:carboxylesterase family protein n=1 Tax=Nonomuraea jabiensis TaxID=882448 RepID=UPI003430BD39
MAAPAYGQAGAGPVVVTQDGPVTGVREQGVSVFRGIPYAAPPIGPRRFLPPAPPQKWTGPKDASRLGPACVQDPDEHEAAEGTPMSEDCLTLPHRRRRRRHLAGLRRHPAAHPHPRPPEREG